MFDHITEKHNHVQIDKLTDFKFEVVKGFRDPLTRQITEAIRKYLHMITPEKKLLS